MMNNTARVLLLSDLESNYLWDCNTAEKLKGYDLILSCGDLNPHYLSCLATFTDAPVLYVHGNHDECYERTPPEGCICVEDRIYRWNGLRILGLGGSMRYRQGAHQYTEREMRQRIRRLSFDLWRNHGFDILLTHSAAYQLGDGEDNAHVGFRCFRQLMEKYRPPYMIHGHIHRYLTYAQPRRLQFEDTTIINAYERYVLELPLPERPGRP